MHFHFLTFGFNSFFCIFQLLTWLNLLVENEFSFATLWNIHDRYLVRNLAIHLISFTFRYFMFFPFFFDWKHRLKWVENNFLWKLMYHTISWRPNVIHWRKLNDIVFIRKLMRFVHFFILIFFFRHFWVVLMFWYIYINSCLLFFQWLSFWFFYWLIWIDIHQVSHTWYSLTILILSVLSVWNTLLILLSIFFNFIYFR